MRHHATVIHGKRHVFIRFSATVYEIRVVYGYVQLSIFDKGSKMVKDLETRRGIGVMVKIRVYSS